MDLRCLWIFSCTQLINTCSKLAIKNRVNCWICSMCLNTAWHDSSVFIVGFDHSKHISIVFLILTLNKYLSVGCKRRVIMLWKHKKRYICFIIKVARPISFSDSSLHRTEIHYEHNMKLCFSFKFPLGITSVLLLLGSVIWSAISSLFPRDLIFSAVLNRTPIKIIEREKK